MAAMGDDPTPPKRTSLTAPTSGSRRSSATPRLWPVLVTAAGAFTSLGAWALLVAFVERNPFGVAALLVLLWITVDAGIRYRRSPGGRFLLASIAAFWLLSIGAAVGVRWMGWF